MAPTKLFSALLSLSMAILLCFVLSTESRSLVQINKNVPPSSWCIAIAGADKLQQGLDFACANIDCNPIQSGGACFSPDNLESHASFVFNRYFKSKGSCNFDGSMFSLTDPSYGQCKYD